MGFEPTSLDLQSKAITRSAKGRLLRGLLHPRHHLLFGCKRQQANFELLERYVACLVRVLGFEPNLPEGDGFTDRVVDHYHHSQKKNPGLFSRGLLG